MRRGLLPALLLALLAVGLAAWGGARYVEESSDGRADGGLPGPSREEPVVDPPPRPVRFIAWGDTGTGDDGQRSTARAAEAVCERDGCDVVLQLGDNIYLDGVEGIDDAGFDEKFEDVYANLSVPFLVALGNHDTVRAENGSDNGDHQVAYGRRHADDRWEMPGRWHDRRIGDVHFFALDLTLHAQEDPLASPRWATLDGEQREWFDRRMNESDAPWKIVFAHFPYASNGKHGDAGVYDNVTGKGAEAKRFVEELVCGRADLYLAGHDHNLQWLEPVPSCPGTQLVVSGAAAVPRPLVDNGHRARFQAGDTLGFFWFEVQGDALLGRVYDAEGSVLFQTQTRAR